MIFDNVLLHDSFSSKIHTVGLWGGKKWEEKKFRLFKKVKLSFFHCWKPPVKHDFWNFCFFEKSYNGLDMAILLKLLFSIIIRVILIQKSQFEKIYIICGSRPWPEKPEKPKNGQIFDNFKIHFLPAPIISFFHMPTKSTTTYPQQKNINITLGFTHGKEKMAFQNGRFCIK